MSLTKSPSLGLSNVICSGPAIAAEMAKGQSADKAPLVCIFTGESNSGGLGLNSRATPDEMKARPAVQILNLTDGTFEFEPLQLGVNNLRAHAGLEPYFETCHGLENGLANAVEQEALAKRKPVYLIKTGQGGSLTAQWQPTAAGGYWNTFLERIAAARRQLPAQPRWVVWMSLGINDGIAGTSIVTWKQNTIAHVQRIKVELPGCIIIMTQFQSIKKYPQIDAAIGDIAALEPWVYAVDTTGATLTDNNHWDYEGLNTVAQTMITKTRTALTAQAPDR